MLLVSQRGPRSLRVLLSTSALLPSSRRLTIELGSALLTAIEHILPKAFHRQLTLTSALMGMLDGFCRSARSTSGRVVDSASLAREAVSAEKVIVALTQARTADGNSVVNRILGDHTSARCPKILRSRGSSGRGRARFHGNGPPLGWDRRSNQGHVVHRGATNGTSGQFNSIRDGSVESRAAMDGGHHVY